MARRKQSNETRNLILEAASLLFSQRGYHVTTIAEICGMAGTNIASVNYHFGDKQKLYVETWRDAFRRSIDRYPADGGVPENAPAEARLEGFIRALLNRITDPVSHGFEILNLELANPTGLLREVIEKSIEPLAHLLEEIVRDILGEEPDEVDLHLCLMSIHAQCFNPTVWGIRHAAAGRNESLPQATTEGLSVDSMTEHVLAFSMGGIMAIRKQAINRINIPNNE